MKNKNQFIYLLLLIFSCFLNYGQNSSSLQLSLKADSLQKKNALQSLLIRAKLLENKSDENYYYFKAKYDINKSNIESEKGDLNAALIPIKAAAALIPKFKSNQTQLEFASEIYNSYYLTSGMSGDWEHALKIAIKCYDFTAEKLPKDEVCIDYLKDIGYIHNQLRNYSESILSYEKALKLSQKLQPNNFAGFARIHNGLGIGYSDSHFRTQSLYHYEKELEFLKKAKQTDNSFIVQALNNVIWENLDYGDQKKAQNFANYLNKNFEKWYKQKDFSKTNTPTPGRSRKEYFKMLYHLSNLRIEVNKKNITKSKAFFDSIEYVFDKLPDDLKKRDYQPYLFARNEYVKLFEFDKNPSKKLQQEHINFNKESIILAKKDKSQHEELVTTFLLANTYNKYDLYPEAIASIEESKKIDENFFSASRFTIQILEAKVLEKTNKNRQATEVLKLAFEKLLAKKLTYGNLKKLSYHDFKKFNSFTFINNTINAAKVQELIYEKTKNKEDLLIANNLYLLASDMFTEFYQKGKYNYSLNKFNQSIASGLLQTQLLIDPTNQKKIKDIINRIENNSSQHLWNIFEVKNKQNLKVPVNLIQKLNELVFEKNSIEEQIEKNKETIQIKNQLAIVEKEIIKIQKTINLLDPSFQKFKGANFSIDATQKKLSANQLLLKYAVTDKKVFAFSIQRDVIQLVALGNKEDLKKVVNAYNNQIRTIDNSFSKNASYLYGKLIQPLIKSKAVSSIIFIPEEFLSAVSFESLKDKRGQLLVQNFTTSYAYSLKLWNISKEKSEVSKQIETIATFAPNYSKLPPKNINRGTLLRAGLYDLVDAKKEAKAISELFGGKLYENQDANRDNFLKSTTNYSLHHLAMHSLLEKDYSQSSLVFANDKKVYFNELYQINFPSKLVVLSACNTGIGTDENGDGIMSLSRALTYAGVKSSVYSLWQVPDKETSEIMICFYENLKKGLAKDLALTNAKNTFIKNNPMKSHPFYWAGFVVNGNTDPVVNSYFIFYIFAAVVAFCALFYFIRKRKFFKKSQN